MTPSRSWNESDATVCLREGDLSLEHRTNRIDRWVPARMTERRAIGIEISM
jgi:hypothetical protein